MRNSAAIANQLPANPLSPGYGNCLLAPATRSQQPPQEVHKEGPQCLLDWYGVSSFLSRNWKQMNTMVMLGSPTDPTHGIFQEINLHCSLKVKQEHL